jgi:DNA repair ATPase RecN
MTDFQAFAANLAVEGEVCDLPHAKFSMQAADEDMAPLIQNLAATSTAEIERLISELQEAKDHLQSERQRIERETSRYTNLTQMASTTARIISDAVSQWHPHKSKTTKAAPASIGDDTDVRTIG